MIKINPYLTFDGNAEVAFNFYKTVFGGELTINRFSEMPGDEIKKEDKNKIMHIALPIGENNLMASDMVEGFGPPFQKGNDFSVSLNPDSKEEAKRLFDALSEGGNVIMPIEDQFFNAYYGMLVDKFGIQWMINFEYE